MPKLQNAQFQRLGPDGTPQGAALKVQYNPTEYSLNKGAQIAEIPIPGLDSPVLQFVRGQTETLSLELFFDTTESGMGQGATSVTTKTDNFYQLVKIDSGTHAPPILLFSWGGANFPGQRSNPTKADQLRYGFKCIVESVRQRYTLFSPEGIPLRAVLSVSLKEYKTLDEQIKELKLESPDHTKTHVVQQGDTINRIAWSAYGDSTEWRRIADWNGLSDPTLLPLGLILEIPPIA